LLQDVEEAERFVNGVFIGILKLNPLIVTLAVGQIVLAWGLKYSRGVVAGQTVPEALSSWATKEPPRRQPPKGPPPIAEIFFSRCCISFISSLHNSLATDVNPRTSGHLPVHGEP